MPEGTSNQGTPIADGQPPAPAPAAPDNSAELAEALKRAEAAEAAVAAQQAEADGKLKEALEAVTAERDAERGRLADIEKKTAARADEIYAKLSKPDKERADLVKGKLGADDWLSYVRSFGGTPANPKPAPPMRTGNSPADKATRAKVPDTTATFMGERFGREPRYLKHVETTKIGNQDVHKLPKKLSKRLMEAKKRGEDINAILDK